MGVDLSENYNPWTLSGGKKWETYWMIQPEALYWFCQPPRRTLRRSCLLGGEYSIGHLVRLQDFSTAAPTLSDHRYRGWFCGRRQPAALLAAPENTGTSKAKPSDGPTATAFKVQGCGRRSRNKFATSARLKRLTSSAVCRLTVSPSQREKYARTCSYTPRCSRSSRQRHRSHSVGDGQRCKRSNARKLLVVTRTSTQPQWKSDREINTSPRDHQRREARLPGVIIAGRSRWEPAPAPQAPAICLACRTHRQLFNHHLRAVDGALYK